MSGVLGVSGSSTVGWHPTCTSGWWVHGEDGSPCDDLLVMRPMPKERRLTRSIEDGQGATAEVHEIAHQVAAFQASVEEVDDAATYAGPDAVLDNWEDSLETIARFLDCLDFSDRYRYGDVLLDAAFLAMELERLGRPDLGGVVLGTHDRGHVRGADLPGA